MRQDGQERPEGAVHVGPLPGQEVGVGAGVQGLQGVGTIEVGEQRFRMDGEALGGGMVRQGFADSVGRSAGERRHHGLREVRRELFGLDFSGWRKNLARLVKTGLGIIAIFLVSNPFVLHPMGWRAFIGSLTENLRSNATNHGATATVTIADKIVTPVASHFLSPFFLLALLSAALFAVWAYRRERRQAAEAALAVAFLLNLGYLLFFVNKAWHHYYLPVFMVGLPLLAEPYRRFLGTWRWRHWALVGVVGLQLVLNARNSFLWVQESHDATVPDFNEWSLERSEANSAFIGGVLRRNGVTSNSHVLLSPYTGFHFSDVGLQYGNMSTIFGCFSEDVLDPDAYVASQRRYWGDAKSPAELLKSFKPKDFVVLRRNEPFIDTSRLGLLRDQDACRHTADLVERLLQGGLPYDLVGQNDDIYVFKKR